MLMRVMRFLWKTIPRETSSMSIRDNLLKEEILGEEDGYVVLDKKSDVRYEKKYKRKGKVV